MLTGVWQDLRYALRMLGQGRGFTAMAVLTLALGIGATTAIFSLVHALLLRRLPFRQPDRLVMIWETAPSWPKNNVSVANFVDWKRQSRSFESMGAFFWYTFNLTGAGEPEKLEGQLVTAGFFETLAIEPVLGRFFAAEEDQLAASSGVARVVIVSYGLWKRRFGGDPKILGSKLTLNDTSYTVIGVMPPSFRFPARDVELWVPAAFNAQDLRNRGSHYLRAIGRLKPGATPAQAQAEMEIIARHLEQAHPETNTKTGVRLSPLQDDLVGEIRTALLVMSVGVGFVLLIACANVANLLLVRATGRRREVALRTALGAGRFRLVRQLLTESVLLSLCGGASGVLVALWSFSALSKLVPSEMAHAERLGLNVAILGFTFGISLLTGITFGLAPAIHACRLDVNAALKRSCGISDGRSPIRSLLAGAEIALAVALLAGAGLLLRSFVRLLNVDAGFRPDHLLTMRLVPSPTKYRELPKRAAFYRAVLERVHSVPEVEAAGMISFLPLFLKGGTWGFLIEGRTYSPGENLEATYRVVTPGYFKAMRIPILKGRGLEEADNETSMPVAVISEVMAQSFWPERDPIGQRLILSNPYLTQKDRRPPLTVVGIVGNVRDWGLAEDLQPEMYVTYTQHPQFGFRPQDLVVRTRSEPLQLAGAIRSEIWKVDKDQTISNVMTMEQVISSELGDRRLQMLLLGAFAAVAVTLAAAGIYGVIAYSVVQRTHEIGIRIALGAQRGDILRLIVQGSVPIAAGGVAAGLAAAFALTRFMTSLLFGIQPTDPATYAAVALLLGTVALLASYLPARRAAGVEPVTALKHE